MIKASQGCLVSENAGYPFTDTAFVRNVKGASENGIKCGAYHFLTGVTEREVELETNYFIGLVSRFRGNVGLFCACDIEDARYKKLTKAQNTALVRLFADMVKEAGFTPVVYTNNDFRTNYLDLSALSDIGVWYATYRKTPSPTPKPDVPRIVMYQWSDRGKVDGIDGGVDLDEGYFEKEYAVGDRVRFRSGAVTYWKDGPKIPGYVKNGTWTVLQTSLGGKDVLKGGEKAVLLAGVNTWAAVSVIESL